MPSATVNVFSVISTTARAASASISYPKNSGTGSTQIRHEPVGNHSRRRNPSVSTAEYRSLPRWLNPSHELAGHGLPDGPPVPCCWPQRYSRSCSAGCSWPARRPPPPAPRPRRRPPPRPPPALPLSRRIATSAPPRRPPRPPRPPRQRSRPRPRPPSSWPPAAGTRCSRPDGGVCSVPGIGDIGAPGGPVQCGFVRPRRRAEQHLHARGAAARAGHVGHQLADHHPRQPADRA